MVHKWFKAPAKLLSSDLLTKYEIGIITYILATISDKERALTKKEMNSILGEKERKKLSKKINKIASFSLPKLAGDALEGVIELRKKRAGGAKRARVFRTNHQKSNALRNTLCNATKSKSKNKSKDIHSVGYRVSSCLKEAADFLRKKINKNSTFLEMSDADMSKFETKYGNDAVLSTICFLDKKYKDKNIDNPASLLSCALSEKYIETNIVEKKIKHRELEHEKNKEQIIAMVKKENQESQESELDFDVFKKIELENPQLIETAKEIVKIELSGKNIPIQVVDAKIYHRTLELAKRGGCPIQRISPEGSNV